MSAAYRLDELFLEQVRLRPDAVAVCGDTVLTYRELATRSVRVAAGLARLGTCRETLVGMSFGRGIDAIVATVGIVLAGGAYVPISPTYPARRITELLVESSIGTVVCAADAMDVVAAAAPDGVEVVDLVDIVAWGGAADPDTFEVPAASDDRSPLAHVLFTSGSTGAPKGVMVEHAGVCRIAREPEHLRFTSEDHVLQANPLEFDAATMEIWGALLNGARLCIVDTSVVVVPDRFATALREHGITVGWVTAPLFNQLVDEDPTIFAPLERVFTGGDVVSPRHVNTARAHSPNLTVHNGYGPTENTVFTTLHRIEGDHDGPVPIGRPVHGTTVLVLDDRQRPVSPGTVGELYAGGVGVARGYVNSVELTRERFVVIDGERCYRTGDLVHRDHGGLLHFHGRVDGQAKVRGHRVETAEVTTALLAVPGVEDAHVRVVGSDAHDKRLVAFLVATGTDEASVRAGLATKLPDYLLPDQYLWLARLPLNANGKVDASALAMPTRATGAARHSAEQRGLAELWGEVLDLPADTIGPDDAFLDIGGNSIKLGTLLGRLDRRLDVRLSLADAVRARTLADMARSLTTANTGRSAPIAVPERGQPVDLHPAQRGTFARWLADPESLVYNVPVRIRLRGPVAPDVLRRSLEALVDRHDALRMRFLLRGGEVRQVANESVRLDFVSADARSDEPAGFVRPFRPERPPLVRGLLVRIGLDTHDLYLDAHHVVFDGVSLAVLVDELLELYRGAELPVPPTTFAGAAQWCRGRPVSETAEAFWLDELAGVSATGDLPTDRPRGPHRAVRGATVRRDLDAADLTRLERAARRAGTTPFTIGLAAYAMAIARWSGESDVVVGTPATGRHVHPDLDRVVGMFVNMVCLRAAITPSTTASELVEQVDARRRAALPHQDYPFDRLVSRLGLPRDPARNPVFDVVFAYQDLEFHEFDRDGLHASVELLDAGTTRFDLNLQAYRRPDRLVLELEYASDLFLRDNVERLLDQFLTALTQLIDDPEAPVSREPARARRRSPVP